MAEKIAVRFEGDGGGVAELSWGQQEIWSVMRDKGSSLTMGSVRALPPGQTVPGVATALGDLMSRHQSLRTRLLLEPGGRTRQDVHVRGEIGLEVIDAGDGDPGEAAAAALAGYRARNFDYEREWPLRMAVITRQGAATHVAEAVCHIAADAFGLAALHEDFDRLLPGPARVRPGPVTAMPPAEQAARQQGSGARRAHEASMRYFERLAAVIPDRQFPSSRDPREPRFWQVTLESPAARLAAGTLAARFGLTTSPVLLAAFATAFSGFTGQPSVALHLVVSNRFRPGFAGSVSPVMQTCLAVLPADAPFGEVARRAWQSALGAYKHAYYDPEAKIALCEQLALGRGTGPDWSVVFNDRRVRSREPSGDAPAGASQALGNELSRSRLIWGDRDDMPQEKLSLNIIDAPDALCAEVRADTCVMRPQDMAELLRRMETILVEEALAEDVTAGPVASEPIPGRR